MVTLTVEAVRRHLSFLAEPAAGGAARPAALAAVLEELYAALTGADPSMNLAAPLELADASAAAWRGALIDHAFITIVAAALARHEAALQTQGAAVLEFWQAAQELCGWLAGLMHAQRAADTTRSLESLRRDLFAVNDDPALKAWFAQLAALHPRPVAAAAWRDSLPACTPGGSARFILGAGVDGLPQTADLSESQCPHVLVGATADGSTVGWLRTCVASLLAVNTPATLRLAIADPQRGPFLALADSPFLWVPPQPAAGLAALLEHLDAEVERRLAGHEATPRIVCMCHDYPSELPPEEAARAALGRHVARIAGRGRAAGVHLVIATSRFGRDLLQGALGGLPARVAFNVPRKADSRLLIGAAGAEVLGPDELLYKDLGAPLRLRLLPTSATALAALSGRQPGTSPAV